MKHSKMNSDIEPVSNLQSFSDPPVPMPPRQYGQETGNAGDYGQQPLQNGPQNVKRPKRSVLWQLLGLLAELLATVAALFALYIVWLMWWTGVQSEHTQMETRQKVSWSDPSKDKTVKVAEAQEGDPPVQPTSAKEGDLVALLYVPHFGSQWQRNIVEGTTPVLLNKHGLGHYPLTQLPGEMGNFAVAGHRNGYGQPLGDVDMLQEGDAIIVRTKDYWYVYKYTSYEIVKPTQVSVIAPNPESPSNPATKRMITLTTCEPKYSTPTHRWISHGELQYWAKVSDGVPKELSSKDRTGAVKFINNGKDSPAATLSSLVPVLLVALAVYLVLFLAAAVVWRWPLLRAIHKGEKAKPDISIYAGLYRHQPGPAAMRWILLVLLLITVIISLLQWLYPWLASTIPYLRDMSNYVAV